MGSHRFFYNQAVAYHREHGKVTPALLRQELINDEALDRHGWQWAKAIPYDVKDEALRDFMKALKSNFAKKKANPNHHFEMRFKSKKSCRDNFVIHKKHWKAKRGFYSWTSTIQSCEALPQQLPTDSRIVRERNQYFLMEAQTTKPRVENQDRRLVCSLDPNIRTFMAGYDPEGQTFEWGRYDSKRLHRLFAMICKVQKLLASANHRKRRNLQALIEKLRHRIRCLVDDCHYKLIKFLTTTYQNIVIPVFKVQEMMQSKLNKKTKQQMSLWSHFTFRRRLQDRATTMGCHVHVVTEECTSRTCTCCGFLNRKSSDKQKICGFCGFSSDRDINGARNILLKTITEEAL